jgi:tRNA-splicing ligase RtcB
MAKRYDGPIERLDEVRWRIPRDSNPAMRVDGILYADDALIEDVLAGGGPAQVANVASLPGIVSASLAMPDIHWGYGFPIGGVAATDVEAGGVVSPGGVGYDINCGVRLLRTEVPADDVKGRMKAIVDRLFAELPLGVGVGGPYAFDADEIRAVLRDGARRLAERGLSDPADLEVTESGGCLEGADPSAVSDEAVRRGGDQCGTLGAGNHFVEVQVVDEVYDERIAEAFCLPKGALAVMIHSGSRGLGHQICQDALKAMRSAPGKYGIDLPDRQLVCAPTDSPEGRRYLGGMRAAANFAWANRQLLAEQVKGALARALDASVEALGVGQVYDVAHNVAKFETHDIAGGRRRLCVHRKGATRAFGPGHHELPPAYRASGQPVLIPGDMGSGSYVLAGTDEAMRRTFGSACHGAGRVWSRKEAIRQARGRRIEEELASRGVIARARGRTGLAEEQPDAYKDVSSVVACVEKAGLARRVARLRPLGVVKG